MIGEFLSSVSIVAGTLVAMIFVIGLKKGGFASDGFTKDAFTQDEWKLNKPSLLGLILSIINILAGLAR